VVVCVYGFCNVCMCGCVCMGFVMCVCVGVCVYGFCNVCMCGFCNVWVCVYGFSNV
jgi:hypothetical protein